MSISNRFQWHRSGEWSFQNHWSHNFFYQISWVQHRLKVTCISQFWFFHNAASQSQFFLQGEESLEVPLFSVFYYIISQCLRSWMSHNTLKQSWSCKWRSQNVWGSQRKPLVSPSYISWYNTAMISQIRPIWLCGNRKVSHMQLTLARYLYYVGSKFSPFSIIEPRAIWKENYCYSNRLFKVSKNSPDFIQKINSISSFTTLQYLKLIGITYNKIILCKHRCLFID